MSILAGREIAWPVQKAANAPAVTGAKAPAVTGSKAKSVVVIRLVPKPVSIGLKVTPRPVPRKSPANALPYGSHLEIGPMTLAVRKICESGALTQRRNCAGLRGDNLPGHAHRARV